MMWATPDELDIISTSKNHDVKNGILSDGDPNDWFFALINLQTMAGQIGNGHYPISRMQSGWKQSHFLYPDIFLTLGQAYRKRHYCFTYCRFHRLADALGRYPLTLDRKVERQ